MRTMQFNNCQLKINNYDKKYPQLQNILSHGFCRVFARVYLSSWLFLFLDSRQGPFAHTIFTHFSTMAFREHSYAIPVTTMVSLHLLCGTDFPDAVPFHITKMGSTSPLDTGEYTLRMVSFRHDGAFQRLRIQCLLSQPDGTICRQRNGTRVH